MRKIYSKLARFLTWSDKMAARPLSFFIALIVVFIWLLIGLIRGFNETGLLIINTIATINAALMVFIIQNTQHRNTTALHLKLDELIRAVEEAENELVAIEEMEEEELAQMKKRLMQRKKEK